MPPRLARSVAIAALLAVASLAPTAAAAENRPPTVGPIVAELSPPRTVYVVDASDPDGDTLQYTWEWSGACGEFTPAGPRAVWSHPHPPCSDEPLHAATIVVYVTDGRSPHVRREYTGGSASGTGPADDDPRDEPPPVVVGEEIDCEQNSARSAFAPTQGAWQDDELFEDAPGKRLSRNPSREGWIAEMPMVKDRPTLLFGVRGDRYNITYDATLSGTVEGDVRIRFQLVEAATSRVEEIGRWPATGFLRARAFGACGAPSPVHERVPTPMGLPADRPAFSLQSAGRYQIIAELVDARDTPIPNTQARLDGQTVEIPPVTVRLVGLAFAPPYLPARAVNDTFFAAGPPVEFDLDANLSRIEAQLERFAADLLPLPPGGLIATTTRAPAGVVDFEALRAKCAAETSRWDDRPAVGELSCLQAWSYATLYAKETVAGWTSGARGTLLVLPRESYALASREASLGEAIADKFAIMVASQGQWVAEHELVHVWPFPFAGGEECGHDYHHKGKFGNGFRITYGGVEARAQRDRVHGLMTAASASDAFVLNGERVFDELKWVEQCTYWHLVNELQRKADPPLQALVLMLTRLDGGEQAEILSGLTMLGEPDVAPGAPGTHAVVWRDAAGAELARYGFEARFATETGETRAFSLHALRVERPATAARLEIVGPSGVLLSRSVAAAPVVRIDEASDVDEPFANGSVEIRYRADAAAPVKFTLLASEDGGASWRTLGETNATRAVVDRALLKEGAVVKVVASDGLQSGEATVTLAARTDRAPAPGFGVLALVAALALMAVARRASRAR